MRLWREWPGVGVPAIGRYYPNEPSLSHCSCHEVTINPRPVASLPKFSS